jgi:hypothetical protein
LTVLEAGFAGMIIIIPQASGIDMDDVLEISS